MNSVLSQTQRVCVLIVCDRLQAADELLRLLHYGNYQVEVSTNSDDAHQLDLEHVDLILLDIVLPNGYQLCRQWRMAGVTVPIVFFSTSDIQPDREIVFEFGGSDYLTSPLVKQEVFARLKTHVELQRSQRNFNQMFFANPTPMAISTLDDARVLAANPAFSELAGYPLADLIGRSTLDLNIWADPADRSRIVQTLLAHRPIQDREIQGYNRAGELKTVLLSSELIDYEGQTCLFSRAIDITARKQMDEQRQRRAEMYTLLSNISRQLLNQDPDTAIQFTLAAIGKFTASDRVNIIQTDANQKTLSMTHEWCMDGIAPCLKVVQGMKPEDCPWILQQLLSGEPLEITRLTDLPPEAAQECVLMAEADVKSTVIVPMLYGGTIAGYLGADAVRSERVWTREDISLFRLVGELIAIAQARYAAEETQRLYLHAVSHDLRNPVVGMSMIVKNLLTQSTTNHSPNQPAALSVPLKVLTRMDSSCDRQLHLINSLVEANEVEMWGIALQRQPIALATPLEELVENWMPMLNDHQATLDYQVAPDLPLVYADPTQIWRVVENLLANALKHNPPGIRLTLTAQAIVHPASPTATATPDQVRCAVADNGTGIDATQAIGMFERYRRGTSAAKTRGLGLGLYLCRQIVMAHGGEIGVETSRGNGAEFWFTLPIYDDN